MQQGGNNHGQPRA
jgi:hypothetical protein